MGENKSVELAAAKARAHRVSRLRMTLEKKLDSALAALDALMAEAAEGDSQSELWEALHGASVRDGMESELADAYARCLAGPRMKRLPPAAAVEVLMHAADFFLGVRGDEEAAERHLEQVLKLDPAHATAFARLERRFDKLRDGRRLLELFAIVADAPPRAANVLAQQAYQRLLTLDAREPLSDATCARLLALVPENAKLLDALDKHCCATGRPALAAELVESALLNEDVAELTHQRRHRLLVLYLGEAKSPEKAIPHVERLLAADVNDGAASRAAERLLSIGPVASRAAAVLMEARRARRSSGSMMAAKPHVG